MNKDIVIQAILDGFVHSICVSENCNYQVEKNNHIYQQENYVIYSSYYLHTLNVLALISLLIVD
jgi:hypothetical protein